MKVIAIVWIIDTLSTWICRIFALNSVKKTLSGDELKLERAALLGSVMRLPMAFPILLFLLFILPQNWVYSHWLWGGTVIAIVGGVLLSDKLKKKPVDFGMNYSTFVWIDKTTTAVSMLGIGGYVVIMNAINYFFR